MSPIRIPLVPELQKDIDEIRKTRQLVPPLQHQGKLPSFSPPTFESYGDVVLVVIPTGNKSKADTIRQKFNTLGDPNKLQFAVAEADSKVGAQPYNEAGLAGGFNRLSSAFNELKTQEFRDHMAGCGIGTVIGVSIESFIQLEFDGDKIKSAVDYGVIIVYNATTHETQFTISEGVPMDPAYVEVARSLGFDDAEKKHGKVTCGKVFASHVSGLDHADWQGVVTGTPRYTTLRKAMDGMDVSLGN